MSIPENLIPKDDIEKTVRAKCEKHGGAGAFDNLNVSKQIFMHSYVKTFVPDW